jgi:hypothetical protein
MKPDQLKSAGLIPVAWIAVSATGSRRGKAVDCLKRQETLLAVSEASRGPLYTTTREAVSST